MFKPTTTEKTDLDHLIDALTTRMMDMTDFESDEYKTMLDHLVKLEAIKKDNRPDKLSADQKASIFAHIAGLLLILQHERAHVIAGKAMSLLSKLR